MTHIDPPMGTAVKAEHPRKNFAGHFLSHYPLRISLVVVITALAGVGLTISSAVVTSTLQRFMIQRVDDQLANATDSWAHRTSTSRTTPYGDLGKTEDPRGSGSSDGSSSGGLLGSYPNKSDVDRPPSDFYVLVVDGPVAYEQFNSVNESKPEVRGLDKPTPPTTVSARPGSASPTAWRAASVQNQDGTVTIVALPLADEEHTITRLIALQVIIGLIALAAIVVASMYIVRRALKPLNQVEHTASLISRGHLEQRIPTWSPNTEVGALSQALNRMLAQIQGAFMFVENSERQARGSEAAMRRFIGDASHELRTPLTSVRGYAELYQSGATDDARMVIDRISEESARMSLLVEDLLALVRMDEGRPLKQDRVDVLELVLHSADSARAGFPGRHVSVNNRCGDIPVVIGDANRLHQVVGNLLTNALRHGGDAAQVQINLSQGSHTVIIEVSDDGNGIAEKDLPHLFERFYRPDVSRSRASGGSGLGLSIVKSLVEAHGGTITVASRLGDGTTFTVELPSAAEDVPEHA
ncbi:sensor histidine kinase [Corynebacterium auriscanis]|uniref:sensor histidine kinase n=2 Tax=Corynebacteriaceae TaxID=1653 RepID=UPI000B026FE5